MLEPAKKNYINVTIVCFLDNLNQIFQTQEVEITWIHCFKFMTLKQGHINVQTTSQCFFGGYILEKFCLYLTLVSLNLTLIQLMVIFFPLIFYNFFEGFDHGRISWNILASSNSAPTPTHPQLPPLITTHPPKTMPYSPPPTQNNPHSLKIMRHLLSLTQNKVQ